MADQGQSADLLWSSEIRLDLLGPVRLGNSAGDDFTPRARKTRALLAILALAKGPVPRAKLTELLWGDRGEEQAKASLRQALYELRPLGAGGYLCADREAVEIGPKKLSTDLAAVLKRMAEADAQAVANQLEAVDCPILGSLDGLTPELDEWLRDERARVVACVVAGALKLGEQALSAGEVPLARRLADLLERIDPLEEQATQLGIRADIAAGDRPAAMRRHVRTASRLTEQLGIAPSADTEALLSEAKAAPVQAKAGNSHPAADGAKPRFNRKFMTAIAVVAMLLAIGIGYALLRPAPVAAAPTVAVLPFDDLGQRKEDYFASGVSDEILNLLAHQQRMKVLGRVSAEQLAGGSNSLSTARELGISYLLDGSVRTAGDRVLVIARLTRVSDGAQVWSDRYERRIGDIFAVQGDIAGAVASRVAQSFAPAAPQETTPDVYDRYLAARQLARERREVTLSEADRLLRQAIAKDPRYAPAFAELADVIMLESDDPTAYGSIPVARARAMAAPFARRAVELDPNLGDGYAALGFLSLNMDAASEPYFRKAVELSPQRPDFHRWHAETLMNLDRYDEAVAEYRRATDIDPLWYLNYDHLIGALYLVGRANEGRAYAHRFLDLSTDRRTRLLIERALAELEDRPADELALWRVLYRDYPDRQSRLGLAESLAELGEVKQARALVTVDPLASAALASNWPALAATAATMGSGYWDSSHFWNVGALLVDSGHGGVIVSMYDRDRPLIDNGRVDVREVASPETIFALRQAGRTADADRLLARRRTLTQQLPNAGQLGAEKTIHLALEATLAGDRERAIRLFDQIARRQPLQLTHVPAMALRYEPGAMSLTSDPRFLAIEERVRTAINAERARAGLPPISHQAWISDPETLLTKN